MIDIPRTSSYEVRPNGNRVEFHLRDDDAKTIAILDVSSTEWQQIWHCRTPEIPPMSMAADHALFVGVGKW